MAAPTGTRQVTAIPENTRPPLTLLCCGVANSERLGLHSLGAARSPPVTWRPPTARRRAGTVTLPPRLTLRETKATWTEAAALRLHAPASLCAYSSFPVPLAAPSARFLANGRHGCPISPPVQSLPGPQVLNQLICCCRRSHHTSGWRHDSLCQRGAFPSASERVVMCVRARRPAGCRACIVPCCSSCGTIRARLELPPPSRLVARFLITKRPHPVPEEAFLC